jgi:hypothetical protein
MSVRRILFITRPRPLVFGLGLWVAMPRRLEHPAKQIKFTWALAALTALSFGFTVTYGFAMSSSNGKLGGLITSVASPTHAVRAMRFLSEATAVLIAALLSSVFDRVGWTVASTSSGIDLSTFLSLNCSTGFVGLLQLLKWKGFVWHYVSIAMRYLPGDFFNNVGRLLSLILIPIMGVVILGGFSQASACKV